MGYHRDHRRQMARTQAPQMEIGHAVTALLKARRKHYEKAKRESKEQRSTADSKSDD